ncbi:TRAP transporter substrate-binding protein [Halomonas sp. WWR20]
MRHAISRCLLAVAVAGLCGTANAATTLRVSHPWPAQSAINQDIIEAWASRVEEASNGELQVQVFPSQTLSKADKAYQGAVNGISDIAVTLQGYTAGRFPLSEIVQLPGVSSSAPQGACILQSLYDQGYLAQEYADSHVLFLFTTGPASLHTRDTEIRTPADLKGLRMRTPSEVSSKMMDSMGAQPISMPAPDIYASLQRGVMDGLSFPWEAMKVFQINELVNYHLDIPYYTGAILATMNSQPYERLSPKMQQVIDEHSGMPWARNASQVFQRMDAEGKQQAIDQGDTLHAVSDPLNDPQWSGPLEEGTRHYLQSLQERGIDNAQEVYQAALELRDAACKI